MKKILILFVGLGSLLVSCDSGIDTIYPEAEEIYLPQIFTGATFVETLTYDDQRRIVQLGVVQNDGQYAKLYTFFYSENKITTVTANYFSIVADGGYNYTEKFRFTYNGNEVTVIKKFLDSGGMSEETTKKILIDANGKILSGYGIEVTYDQAGNITEFSDQSQSYTVKYDDKNGLYKNLENEDWIFYCIGRANNLTKVNNPVEIISRAQDGTILNKTTVSYKYSTDGFPIEIIEKSERPNEQPISDQVNVEYLKIHHD